MPEEKNKDQTEEAEIIQGPTKKEAEVKVYSTPTCPWCHKAKEYFKENNIEFEDFNVAEDEVARAEMVAKSNQMGVPVIDIKGKIIIGFDKDAIDKALGLGEKSEKKAA